MNETDYPKDNIRTWQCGDPYKYAIPDHDGNHWEMLLKPFLDADKAKCDAWKDEVQNLLIFAGLFSAVVTAFVIDSKSSLGPDKESALIDILNRLASNNPSSTISSPGVPFSPSFPSVVINALWFISLILCLTSAIIGIVSLQWLREHQNYPSSLSPKRRFAIFQMRKEGLERWLVPETFAAISILLQFALVLFLFGMIEYVLQFGARVFIPTVVVIGIPLIFLIATSALPSIQAIFFYMPHSTGSTVLPTQCPYKSPQANLLRRLLTASLSIFQFCMFICRIIHTLYRTSLRPSKIIRRFGRWLSCKSKRREKSDVSDDLDDRKEMIHMVFTSWGAKTWLAFDEQWLKLRDLSARASFNERDWPSLSDRHSCIQLGPLHDLVKGILTVASQSLGVDTQFGAYGCVQELSSAIIGEHTLNRPGTTSRSSSLLYFQNLLNAQDRPSITFTSILRDVSPSMMRDENAFIALSQFRHPHQEVAQHFIELHIRLTNYIYLHPRTISSNNTALTFPQYPRSQLLRLYGMGNRRPLKSPDALFDSDISEQFHLAIKSFFESATDPDHHIENAFEESIYAGGFGDLLAFIAIRQPDDSIQPTLDFISNQLHSLPKGEHSDFLYYTGSCYARALLIPDPYVFRYLGNWDDTPAVTAFLHILQNYRKDRIQPSDALRVKLGIPKDSDEWWDFLRRLYEARPRRPVSVSRVGGSRTSESMSTIVGIDPLAESLV